MRDMPLSNQNRRRFQTFFFSIATRWSALTKNNGWKTPNISKCI